MSIVKCIKPKLHPLQPVYLCNLYS